MNPEPVVSVLMPVYNGEKFLDEAIQSILSQSFGDFELIAIDDGSTDSTRSILEGYAHQDGRVKVFAQENRGLVITLNRGLNLACGKYLARMDADDISMPERLEQQVTLMEQHADIVLLGSVCNLVREDRTLMQVERPPQHDTIIRWQILFDNPFIHSAVMLRTEILKRHSLEYCQEAVLAEDYNLWSRLLDFGRGQNLDMPLVTRRYHDRQISENFEARGVSAKSATRIAQANLSKLGINLTEEKVNTLRFWSHYFPRILNTNDESLCFILVEILEAFCRQPNLNQEQVQLVRGRTALRLLMARSNKAGGEYWKFRMIQRLHLTDLIWVLKYIQYRKKLLRQFPYAMSESERLYRR